MRKTVGVLLCTLLAGILCFGGSAPGAEAADFSKGGSITLHLTDQGTELTGGDVTFYQVGTLKEGADGSAYRLTAPFQNTGCSLSDLSDPELAVSLSRYAKAEGISGTRILVEQGKTVLRIPKEKFGLYLVVQTTPCDGYLPFHPFFAGVPQKEETGWIYDVNGTPKLGMPEKNPDTDQPDADQEGGGTEPGPKPDFSIPNGGSANQTGRLPQTGTLNWPIPVLALTGLILFGAGWLLNRKEKRENDEK